VGWLCALLAPFATIAPGLALLMILIYSTNSPGWDDSGRQGRRVAASKPTCHQWLTQELWERKLVQWTRHTLKIDLRLEVPEVVVRDALTMAKHFQAWEQQVSMAVKMVIQTNDQRVRDSAAKEVEKFLRDFVAHPPLESGGHLPGDYDVVRTEQNGFDFFKEYRDWVPRYDEAGHLLFLEYAGNESLMKGMTLKAGEKPPEGMDSRLADVVQRTLLGTYLPFENEAAIPFVKDPARRRHLLEGAKRSYLRWRLIEVAEYFYRSLD
jgi:hypothetical protein